MSDRIANKVYKTSNYDKFKPFKGNRGHTSGHIRVLAESMKADGWWDSFPMSVKRSDNGEFSILDGHNRFHAAKAVGAEVKYTVVNGEFCDDHVYKINQTQRRWSTTDYIKSFARMGYKEYETVVDFMGRHKCSAVVACHLLTNKPNVPSKEIQSGDLKIFDIDKADRMIACLKQITAASKASVFRANFLRVFIKACNTKGFSAEKFVSQVTKRPHLVINYTKEADICRMFEEIYNFGCQGKSRIPLAFLIQQY